jgi:hypothetical protein
MAHFLRDEQVKNITIDTATLRQLAQSFAAKITSMPEYLPPMAEGAPEVFLTFTIRFDGKGYRLFDIENLISHFEQAARVERIIFELQSGTSLRSNRVIGSYADLRLDSDDRAVCFLTVSSDSEGWMQSTFAAVIDVLGVKKNKTGYVRNAWVELIIQLVGVLLGFLFSVWAAIKVAPKLRIENSFLITFILALLVYSNFWAYINQRLRGFVFGAFPIIRFDRSDKDRLHWLYQAIVGGIVVAAALWLLNLAFTYVGNILGPLVGTGA